MDNLWRGLSNGCSKRKIGKCLFRFDGICNICLQVRQKYAYYLVTIVEFNSFDLHCLYLWKELFVEYFSNTVVKIGKILVFLIFMFMEALWMRCGRISSTLWMTKRWFGRNWNGNSRPRKLWKWWKLWNFQFSRTFFLDALYKNLVNSMNDETLKSMQL